MVADTDMMQALYRLASAIAELTAILAKREGIAIQKGMQVSAIPAMQDSANRYTPISVIPDFLPEDINI
jgi:hypothetical protein